MPERPGDAMQDMLVVGAVFVAMGLIFALVIARYTWREQARRDNRQMVCAKATVVKSDLEAHDMGVGTSRKRARLYTPTVKYMDMQGIVHTVKASCSHYPERYHVGDVLDIRYDMSDKKSVELEDEDGMLMVAALIASVFGFLFVLIGTALVLMAIWEML